MKIAILFLLSTVGLVLGCAESAETSSNRSQGRSDALVAEEDLASAMAKFESGELGLSSIVEEKTFVIPVDGNLSFDFISASATTSGARADCFKARYTVFGETIQTFASRDRQYNGRIPMMQTCLSIGRYILGNINMLYVNHPSLSGKIVMSYAGSGETARQADAGGFRQSESGLSELSVVAKHVHSFKAAGGKSYDLNLRTIRVGYYYFVTSVTVKIKP